MNEATAYKNLEKLQELILRDTPTFQDDITHIYKPKLQNEAIVDGIWDEQKAKEFVNSLFADEGYRDELDYTSPEHNS